MEVIDKRGTVIQTGWVTVSHTKFLNEIIKPYTHIRVGVVGGKEPFACTYFKVSKEEVVKIVRSGQYKVRFSIMFNSKMNGGENILYINKMAMSSKVKF